MAVISKERRESAGMFCTVGDQMSVRVVATRSPRQNGTDPQREDKCTYENRGIVHKNMNSGFSRSSKAPTSCLLICFRASNTEISAMFIWWPMLQRSPDWPACTLKWMLAIGFANCAQFLCFLTNALPVITLSSLFQIFLFPCFQVSFFFSAEKYCNLAAVAQLYLVCVFASMCCFKRVILIVHLSCVPLRKSCDP